MPDPARTARRRVLSAHASVVDGIDACADAVAEPWESDRTTDRDAVVDGLRGALSAAGIDEALPGVLADAVAATGHDLRAAPVAAPPYVVVTSRGPLLRATIDPGRLVIRFDAFGVVRDPGRRPAYRRLEGVDVAASLE